ncbi:MAG: 4-hydroxythreonine-4-phosphate dehydrogenase PdxA [Bacillota bacterium]
MEPNQQKPFIGIVLGDPAGIGPEIVLKLLMRPSTYSYAKPVLIGSYDLLCQTTKRIGCELFFSRATVESLSEDVDPAYLRGIPVVNIDGDTGAVVLGEVSATAGKFAYDSIVCGYGMLDKHLIAAMIMAPISKQALAISGCGFRSEYELFAHLAGVSEVQSVVKGGSLFRSSVIGHVPFRKIIELLSTERIVDTGVGLHHVLRDILGVSAHICIAALNPHGGEGGILGEEEAEIIIPAVEELQRRGIDISGPYPSDTIYSRAVNNGYDGIIYLYHDQGNIAMKAKMFETTALIYTNVPYSILSTGHGSAMDIAPLGIANATNLCYVMSTLTTILQKKSGTTEQIR